MEIAIIDYIFKLGDKRNVGGKIQFEELIRSTFFFYVGKLLPNIQFKGKGKGVCGEKVVRGKGERERE